MPTGIPYADEVWNPVIGCTKIKSGCKFCWAERLHDRRYLAWFAKLTDWTTCPKQYWLPFSEVQLLPQRLDGPRTPLHWRKPRTIFVCSMSDIFHKDVPFEFIDDMAAVIRQCPQHTFQLFTKRWERALAHSEQAISDFPPNVHLFFSVSTQPELDEAVPYLLPIPAAKRGLSLEPLLGAVKLTGVRLEKNASLNCLTGWQENYWNRNVITSRSLWNNKLDSVIVGCESGPNRRPCKLEWIRSIVKQCQDAGVCVYVKQMEIAGKVCTDMSRFPEDLQVREYPK